ncbi:MAG: SPOR domain-containing protein [Gemmatimonadota bacterium]
MSASIGSATAVAVLGDDPDATGAVALGIARSHSRTRRVFLFDLLGGDHRLGPAVGDDEALGVSDMVNFGVSLGRTAHALADAPNLFLVSGGAESPLNEAILTDRWWAVIVEQVRRANALLLIAAPSMVPGMREMVSHLNGVLLVGEAAAPTPFVTVLGEVRAASTLRAQVTPTGSARPTLVAQPRSRWPMIVAGVAAVALAAAVTAPRWRPLLGLDGGTGSAAGALSLVPPPLPPEPSPIVSQAAYSVELLFTNSNEDALRYLAPAADTLPAATFAIVSRGLESEHWYRLVAGAFPDSASAEGFLGRLRGGGRLTTGEGSIARTPFALLLDSASSDAIAQVRVSAYRGRGIPAYVLLDSAQVWRVYAGAFPSEDDAKLLKQQLDSLNIQSVLVTRAGSTP